MQDDFSLFFLTDLGHNFTDKDVEEIWHMKVFPLRYTADFNPNWRAVAALDGRFATPSGIRCQVQPRAHHRVYLSNHGIMDEKTLRSSVYEAIVFGKVSYAQSQNQEPKATDLPDQVKRRMFLNDWVRKLPARWRHLIIYSDLHLYDEHTSVDGGVSRLSCYRPLSSFDNIRLLLLLPSELSAAQIECQLEEVAPDLSSTYEALSYVWGSKSSCRSIVLNEQPFSVTENLEAAIRHLRPRDGPPRRLWIDAICINQSDIVERTEQVARLDRIYQNASQVVVWLGRESNTSAEALKVLNYVGDLVKREAGMVYESNYHLQSPFYQNFFCPECDAFPPKLLKDLDSDYIRFARFDSRYTLNQDRQRGMKLWQKSHLPFIEALFNILNRPWWRRVWVLQEATLARNVTIQCGPGAIDWKQFQLVLSNTTQQTRRRRGHHRCTSGTGTAYVDANNRFLSKASSTFAFVFLQNNSNIAQQIGTLSMADLLSLTGFFEATDPRDRIFGLYGLLPPSSPERQTFKPDYTISTRALFIQSAKYFITTSQRLDVITARPRSPQHQMRRAINEENTGVVEPSWVGDWSRPRHWSASCIWISVFSEYSTPHRYVQALDQAESGNEEVESGGNQIAPLQLFNASFYDVSPFSFEFDSFDEILRAPGITVDTIEAVGQPWDLGGVENQSPQARDHSTKQVEALRILLANWKAIARLKQGESYPFAKQSHEEAFWRTIFLDRYRGDHRFFKLERLPRDLGSLSDGLPGIMGNLKLKIPPNNVDEERRIIWHLQNEDTEASSLTRLNVHCTNLCMFRTRDGHIGVGHPNARPGDKIVILQGAQVPIILRQYDEGYILIGQSYVHGIMDGEVIQAELKHGRGKKLEDFESFDIL